MAFGFVLFCVVLLVYVISQNSGATLLLECYINTANHSKGNTNRSLTEKSDEAVAA